MTADDDNLVLRLLREMRGDIHEIRRDTTDLRGRMTTVERHLDEMRESMALVLGYAVHSNKAVEGHGERFDEINDQIEALRRRVADLESQRP